MTPRTAETMARQAVRQALQHLADRVASAQLQAERGRWALALETVRDTQEVLADLEPVLAELKGRTKR